MKKARVSIALVVLFALAVAAMGTGTVLAADELVIALVPKATTSQWFLPARDGVEQAFADAGRNIRLLYVSGSSETDVAGQINTVQNLISRNVDGIIISATDGRALGPVVDEAMDA